MSETMTQNRSNLPTRSLEQWKAFALTSRCSASISIIASAAIVYRIMKNRKKSLHSIKNRVLLMMSIVDILQSGAMAVTTSAYPRELSSKIYGAVGNESTCRAQGFFISVGTAVPLYNTMLCIYFTAVIRYKIPDPYIESRFEPFMHTLCVLLPVAQGIIGLSTKILEPTNSGYCWFEGRCRFSDDPGCINNNDALTDKMRYLASVEILLTLVTQLTCLTLIYRSVRALDKTMKKYRTFQRRESSLGGEEKVREIAIQSFLYISSFLITYSWPFILILQLLTPGNIPHWFFMCFSAFYPLQGFWNVLIYFRPRYRLIRLQNLDKSFLWVCKTVIFGEELEPSRTVKRRTNIIVPAPHHNKLNMFDNIESTNDLEDPSNDVEASNGETGASSSEDDDSARKSSLPELNVHYFQNIAPILNDLSTSSDSVRRLPMENIELPYKDSCQSDRHSQLSLENDKSCAKRSTPKLDVHCYESHDGDALNDTSVSCKLENGESLEDLQSSCDQPNDVLSLNEQLHAKKSALDIVAHGCESNDTTLEEPFVCDTQELLPEIELNDLESIASSSPTSNPSITDTNSISSDKIIVSNTCKK